MLASLHSRIALAYAVLMIACVGALTLYMVMVGQEAYLSTLDWEIQGQSRAVAMAAKPLLVPLPRGEEIDALAGQLGHEMGIRVTITDSAGAVLGDSEREPRTMESHAERPEILQALKGSVGESRRRSESVGYDTLYVAVPIVEGDRLLGAARIAVPMSEVNSVSQGVAQTVVLGGLVATALAVGLALVIARSVTGPIKQLTSVASLMAEGNLDRRVGVYSRDEMGSLARAFDLMADRLRDTIKAISSERNTLASVLSTMVDGIVIVDSDGKVVLANRAASVLLRTRLPAMEGRSYVEVLRDHELSAVLRRCLEQGSQQSGTVEIWPGRKLLRLVAAPLRGGQTGALALLQDLTEFRRAETIRRDFIANVSHELRTPLTSLKALVETLEEGAISEPEVALDFLSKMHGEVDGLTQLVNELLELSRIESGQAAFRLEPLEVEPLLRRAVDRLIPQAERAGLTLSVETRPDVPGVRADGQRVQQALVNLVHNAIKFTPSGGSITVGARGEDGHVLLWVSDTGVGIDPEDLPRIFERFFKGDRSRSGGGTGLGLAIAKHVVEAHGGRIWAESAEGIGSTFSFTLPRAEQE